MEKHIRNLNLSLFLPGAVIHKELTTSRFDSSWWSESELGRNCEGRLYVWHEEENGREIFSLFFLLQIDTLDLPSVPNNLIGFLEVEYSQVANDHNDSANQLSPWLSSFLDVEFCQRCFLGNFQKILSKKSFFCWSASY